MKINTVKNLRIIFLISLLPVILSWTTRSCKSLDKLTMFHMELIDSAEIPSQIGINLPFNIYTPPIRTNSSQIFENNDTRKDLIEEIKLELLSLRIFAPENSDFSFLNSIEIYIVSSTLDEKLVAWKYDIGNDVGKELDLELSPEDLSAYIIEDEIELRLSTVTDKINLSDIHLEITAGFFINARILGI